MKLRRLAPLIATAVVLGGLFAHPVLDRLDGLSLDVLFLLRHWISGPRHAPQESPTVVVAIDEESYRANEFDGLPVVMWTPQIARVLNAVNDGGAKVIGFDIILPASIERFVPGYDKDFLLSLKRAASDSRIVLAKVQHAAKPLAPFPGQSFAVGHTRNIRAVNLEVDDDGVVRRVPLHFEVVATGGVEQVETSFGLELAARAGGFTPILDPSGLVFGAYRVPGSENGSILLDFDGGPGAVPTYSFADLSACAARGNVAYFKQAFAGKVVLFGSVLDVEDRKLTSKRFIAGRETENGPPRCALTPEDNGQGSTVARQSLPGVFVHATAINNLLQGEVLKVPPRPLLGAILLVLCVLGGMASQERRISRGVFWLAAGSLVWVVICVAVFDGGNVLPMIDGPLIGVIGFAVPAAVRLAVTDRERNQIRRAFSYYLAPSVIERLLAGNRMPTLGGETRTVTILFSDVEGFSALSEGVSPEALVHTMNVYLGAMTDVIEAHGGFVDKYIGDAIVAVFGAPLDDPAHAANAVRAALVCRDRLAQLKGEFGLPEGRVLHARIGINTGDALVGNIGSRRRFNYTVMGDAVNLASRLESANKVYGTSILASRDTVDRCGDVIIFREIDRVLVKGRAQAAALFEPLTAQNTIPEQLGALVTAYRLALDAYRLGRFAEAAAQFEALAPNDRVSARMAARSRRFAAEPPPESWNGVFALDTK